MSWFEVAREVPQEPFLTALRGAIECWPEPRVPPRFVVAFSGGIDSTVLLAALCRLGLTERVRAVHVDHGLSPEASHWAERCAAVAAELGVEFACERVAVDREGRAGLEAAARDVRYRALGARLGADEVLLTAHHADDQLETVLLRLFRGSGVRGLRGIVGFGPFGRGWLGRPLLRFTRAEIEAQAHAWALSWLDDPSNRSPRHDRNLLRHAVLPHVLERWPAAAANAVRLAEQMAEAEELLETLAAEDARALTVPNRVPRAVLERLDGARQRNLLRYVLRSVVSNVPSALKIDELRRALLDTRDDAQPLVRWPGGEGRVYRQELHLLEPLPSRSPPHYRATLGRAQVWRGPEGSVALERADDTGSGLPESWLTPGLALRFRSGGEALRPLGRRNRAPLRHWFQEAGVLPWMRERIPLLYRGDVLVAVGDLWITADVAQVDADEPRWCVRWRDHPPVV